MPVDDDLAGTLLGAFRIVRKLGQGGTGVVYEALDERLRRRVALKVLPPEVENDGPRRDRFLREARAAAALVHPNIATIFEVGEARGRIFIAMELVPGRTLRDKLERGPLSAEEAISIALQLARGLGKAHAAGIVHRDLKPENVMVTNAGEAKVLDFGLAKLVEGGTAPEPEDDSTVTGAGGTSRLAGTPAYMSPEQALGQRLDARSDVFALGIVTYEMLTGVHPFGSGGANRVVASIVRSEVGPPSGIVTSLSNEVDHAVQKCLAKEADDRFANGDEVAAALLALTKASTTAAPVQRARRSAFVPVGGAAGAVVAIAVVAGLAARQQHAPSPPPASPSSPVASAPRRATTYADLPIPASTVEEARTEYREGLELSRADNTHQATVHFERAATLDGSMAAAHLRLAMALVFGSPVRKRAAFARAFALRSQLDDRDRRILDAFEPIVGRGTEDFPEAVRRIRDVLAQTPDDVELLDWLAFLTSGHPEVAVPAAQHGSELDDGDASAWDALATALGFAGRLPEARRAFEKCAAVAGGASQWCPWELANLDASEGRCEDYERDARRAADGDAAFGLRALVEAFVSLGRPRSAIDELVTQMLAAEHDDADRAWTRLWTEAALAAHDGRLGDALRTLDELARVAAGDPARRTSLRPNLAIAVHRVELLQETGAETRARDVAREFIDRSATWLTAKVPTAGSDRSMWLARLALGRSPELEGRRASWIDELLANSVAPALVWTDAWALTAVTPEDGAAAVEALTRDGRLAAPRGPESAIANVTITGNADAAAGHAYLLAGRATEALPHLQRAARGCDVLYEVVAHVHALSDLGAGLEQTGYGPGACEPYGRIVALWGRAVPKSVTVERVRARMRELHCSSAR